MDDTFRLEIITPERVFLSAAVESVALESTDGRCEVLKDHVPCVIAVASGLLQVKRDGQWRDAACSDGFMEVRRDGATLMLETAEWAEDIDLVRAQRAADRERERLRRQQSMREYRQSKANMARAMARLRVGHQHLDMD